MALRDIVGALRDKEFWRDMGRNTRAMGELGIEFGEGAVGEIGGGVTALGKLATGSSFKEAGETMENVQDWAGSLYEPKYQETEDYMQSIGGAVQPLITGADRGATWLEDKTGGWIPRELTKGSALAALELSPLKFVPTGVPNALRRYNPNTNIGQTVPPRDALGYTPDNLNFNYGDMPFDMAAPVATTGGTSAITDFKQPETTSPKVAEVETSGDIEPYRSWDNPDIEYSGKDIAKKMEEMGMPMSDEVAEMGKVTLRELDLMLPDFVAGKDISALFTKEDVQEVAMGFIKDKQFPGKEIAKKMKAMGRPMSGQADKVAKLKKVTWRELDMMLPDMIAGKDIADLFKKKALEATTIKQPEIASPKVWGSPFEIQKEIDNVRTDLTNEGILSPEMLNENVDSIQKIMLNWDDYVQKYKNVKDKGKPSNDGGRIISADDAKELDPTGKYPKNRALSQDVHEVGSWFVKRLYEEKLAKPPGTGGFDETVMFTAGGTGSGKTTALKNIPGVNKKYRKAEIVYDTNLSNFNSARKKIDQALNTGRDVQIVYVYRGLEDSLENGAVARAAERMLQEGGGRTVPPIEHAKTHVGARNTVEKLQEHYKNVDGVEISVIDNSYGKGGAIESDLSKIEKFSDDISIEKARLDQKFKEMHEAGKIHDIIRNAAKKAKPPKKLSEIDVENMVNQLVTGFS